MKKILAVLLALVAIGGFVFAEDAAPAAAPTGPVVTYGLTGSFGFDAAMANTELALNAADANLVAKSVPLIGFDYGAGQIFKVEPWAQIAWGPFWIKNTVGYKASRYDTVPATETANTYDTLYKIAAGVTFDGLTLSDTFAIDKNNYGDYSTDYGFPYTLADTGYYNLLSMAVVKDNLEGALDFATDMTTAPHFTFYSDAYYAMDSMKLYDWYLKVSNLFGFINTTIGGQDNNYSYNFRPYGMYPSTSVIYYTTTARTGTGLFFSGDDLDVIPVYSEYDLSKWVPLYLQTGFKIPAQTLFQNTVTTADSAKYNDWLAGSNMWFAGKYTLEGVGDFQLGFIPNFGSDYKNVAAAAVDLGDISAAAGQYYMNMNALKTTIFGDFNLSLVPNLKARLSFDAAFGKKVRQDAGAVTGTGTAADPYKSSYYNYSVINFGLEGVYDLKDVVAGLKAYVGVYGGLASGQTNLNSTGTAFPTATAADLFLANYTDATVNAFALGAKPFMFSLRGAYTFENKNTAYVESIFTANAGALKTTNIVTTGATKTAKGYYSSEQIGLNYTVVSGSGKFAISPFFTLYLGVPTAADLGITAASDVATYNASVADQYAPWGLALSYTVSF